LTIGYSRQLAQVALANFDNPAGLIKAGQNMVPYSTTTPESLKESGTGGPWRMPRI